jgi:hypothetical protein
MPKRKSIDSYIRTYPQSNLIKQYNHFQHVIANQTLIPKDVSICDLVHDYKTHRYQDVQSDIEYNQELTVTFTIGHLHVECKQDMWFHDIEYKKIIEGSQNYDNVLYIRFYKEPKHEITEETEDMEPKKVIETLTKDILVRVFTFLHTFLLKKYQHDPFGTNYWEHSKYNDSETSYQTFIPDLVFA